MTWRRGWPAVLAAVLLAAGCTPAPQPAPTPAGPDDAATSSPSRSPSPATPGPSPTPTPSPAAQPLTLTVMSYNTLTGANNCAGCRALKRAGRGDELALTRRMPAVAAKVELAAPDVIGFQENEGPGQLPQAHLAELLAGYRWAEPDSSVPVAVRGDRFAITDSGVTELEKPGRSCRAGDRPDGRYVTWAQLQEVETERRLWVFNTHLHPYDTARCAALRAANLERLVEVIDGHNPDGRLPQLVTGDFNAFGDEDRPGFNHHLAAMAGLGMVDTRQIAAQDTSDVPGAASAGWMTAEVGGRERVGLIRLGGRHVDYVWVPDTATVSSWQVLSGPGVGYQRVSGKKVPYWTGVMASDHSPVVAVVELSEPDS